jgi:hypothetical protein
MQAMLDFTDETTAPHEIAFEAYGVQARVCTNSPELLAHVEPILPPGWQPCPSTPEQDRLGIIAEEDGTFSVYQGIARVSQGQGAKLSLVVLETKLHGHIALHAPAKTFVHAGAVAHNGRAILIPGLSFSGKTTLVAALVRAGAIYYSDEFAVLDSDGLVHPYAKPLSFSVDRHVEELGGLAGEEPVPVGCVLSTYYQPAARWEPTRISTGAAALVLLSNTVTAQSRPEAAMTAVTRAVEDAVVLEGARGEADETAAEVLEGVRA